MFVICSWAWLGNIWFGFSWVNLTKGSKRFMSGSDYRDYLENSDCSQLWVCIYSYMNSTTEINVNKAVDHFTLLWHQIQLVTTSFKFHDISWNSSVITTKPLCTDGTGLQVLQNIFAHAKPVLRTTSTEKGWSYHNPPFVDFMSGSPVKHDGGSVTAASAPGSLYIYMLIIIMLVSIWVNSYKSCYVLF